MADYTIPQLPQALSVHGGQKFEVSDEGLSCHVTFQQMYGALKLLFDQVYGGSPPITPGPGGGGTGEVHIDADTVGQLPYSRLSGAPGATSLGLQLMMATSAEEARQIIGAGTSNVTVGFGANQAKPGNWKPHVHSDTTGELPHARIKYSSGGGGGA